MIEDRAQRGVTQRANVDGARGRRFEAFAAERALQPQDTDAGAEALFGMGPAFENEFAQCGC